MVEEYNNHHVVTLILQNEEGIVVGISEKLEIFR